MRIVPGRRDLDDFEGLHDGGNAGGKARFLSYVVISAVSVAASFGALTMVKDALDRVLGAGTVDRALHEFDPADSVLSALTNTDWPTSSPQRIFAPANEQPSGRRAFGQRKTPPPQLETTFAPQSETGFAPSAAPRHEEADGFVVAARSSVGQAIVVVKPTARSM